MDTIATYPDKVTFYKSSGFFGFGGRWRWKRMAPNGKVVGGSTEGYYNYKDCYDNFVRNVSSNYIIVDK